MAHLVLDGNRALPYETDMLHETMGLKWYIKCIRVI